ncbi:MAG: deoxyribose-phosphate aldolase [Planctomycetota bacterium]
MPPATVNAVMAAERAASFTKRSIKTSAKLSGLRLAMSMLDLTTLEGKDSVEKVRGLCQKAVRPDASDPTVPSVAAICVYPSMVKPVRDELARLGAAGVVKIASVATGFPSGQFPLELRLQDVQQAVAAGADEIDMVINRGAFLAGRYDEVAEEIRQVKVACGTAHLKVILETGELETLDNVRRASDLAIRAMADVGHVHEHGADFIKTSTGKVQPAATMPVTLVMLEAIRDWYLETGKKIGMKPAGGIRSAKQSLHYLVMVKETLGDEWLTPELFRFGASTLCNDIVRQLHWLSTGKYTAGYDVSEA